MPLARWKFDALRAFLCIIKYHVVKNTVFNPHCRSIQDWLATVQKIAVAIKSKWVGCGFSQIAVPEYTIFAWTITKEYIKYTSKGISKETPLIREADRALFSWMRVVKSHYIPQAKPVSVLYCIQSVLKHVKDRECCRYKVCAARKLHYLQSPGELHANIQLFRTDTVINCTGCQLQKKWELKQGRTNNQARNTKDSN
jgi:hypothetical protein